MSNENQNLEAIVNQAVERALGGGESKPAAAPAAPAPKADRLDKLIDLMTAQATITMASNPAFQPPPGAPSAPQFDDAGDDPRKWSTAKINQARMDGTLRGSVERAHGAGEGGLFRKSTK